MLATNPLFSTVMNSETLIKRLRTPLLFLPKKGFSAPIFPRPKSKTSCPQGAKRAEESAQYVKAASRWAKDLAGLENLPH
jgi:hypothetical protein